MADLSDEYFYNNFNTPLSPQGEEAFQNYLKQQFLETGRNLNNDLYDYDLRGYFKAGINPDERGHGPDTYKKPNHPTFSDESIYHNTPSPLGVPFVGGKWGKDNSFTPSPFMLQYTTPRDFLRGYFQRFEPESKLKLPK